MLLSYTAAAVVSVTLAMFLRKAIGNYALRMKTGNQIMFNTTTSFVALAGAGFANAVVMRSNELQKGIKVYDDNENTIGYSKKAAWQAVTQTAYTRIWLAFNTVFIPGMILGMLNNRGVMPKNKMIRGITEVGLLTAMLSIGLPASIAMFAGKGSIRAANVEKSLLEELAQSKGVSAEECKPYYFYYNRGM
jgi:hypothetical protein